MIQHQLFRFNSKLFIQFFLLRITFSRITYLLNFIFSITDLKVNIFQQSLKQMILVLKQHSLAFYRFNEKFVNLTRSFNKVTQLQLTLNIQYLVHYLLLQLSIRLLSHNTQSIDWLYQLKNQWKLNIGVKCNFVISNRSYGRWNPNREKFSLSRINQILSYSLWLSVLTYNQKDFALNNNFPFIINNNNNLFSSFFSCKLFSR